MALKRSVLEMLSSEGLQDSPARAQELRQFLEEHPLVEDYAAFRAALEKEGRPWTQWPNAMRDGVLNPGDYAEESKNYHAYVQWLAHQQMKSLSQKANEKGAGLYLDLPLGVHPDGYDVWKNQGLFAIGTRVGAPPDTFFTLGQDWGFPPIHPERSREQGHKYWADVFRNHFSHAGILRIDHVMGLHRLYWIPEGVDAQSGAYVRYPAEELYAILCLESHRQRCWVIGENLGTVPTYVNRAMSRHGLGKLYVAQFELRSDPDMPLNPVTVNTVVSFNTHDMPPFASWWNGNDIANRLEMGLLSDQGAQAERGELEKTKQALAAFLRGKGLLKADVSPEAVYSACMAYLSTKDSRLLLLNLEDIWLEDQPQNVPGTGPERPNWRRKARYSLDEFIEMPQVLDVLDEIARLR
jgi:4-alpha-glucanotransferase